VAGKWSSFSPRVARGSKVEMKVEREDIGSCVVSVFSFIFVDLFFQNEIF
jgi:hypothetical protein